MSDELRISEITLVNYRQYYGHVNVKFSTKKDVFSVLIGANGAGKSNLWNAIHWCLFGVEPHIKSEYMSSIINKTYLQEKKSYKQMLVKIIMEDKDKKYLIQRQIQGELHSLNRDADGILIMSKEDPVPYGFQIMDTDKSTLFQISKELGRWETKSDKHDFNDLVNQYIIPENLSHFFILDGEFLQDLFDKFKNIKSGIDQISQINVLSDALASVESTRFPSKPRGSHKMNEIQEAIKFHDQYLASENKLGVVKTSKTEVIYGTTEPMHTTGRPRKADLDKSIENMDKDLKGINSKISESNAVYKTQLKEDHGEKLKEKKYVAGRLDRLRKEHIHLLITEGPFMMCKKSIESATNLIRAEIASGKLPNIPKRTLINDLLAKKTCLCGTPLDDGTEARRHVEGEMAHLTDEVRYDIANDIRHHNDRFLQNHDGVIGRMDSELADIRETRAKLTTLTGEIRNLERKLPDDDEDYGDLISKRSWLSAKRDEYLQESALVGAEIGSHMTAKASKLRELGTIVTRVKEEKEYALLLNKSEAVRVALQGIKDDVTKTIRERVSHETLRIFNNLSWKKNYKRLLIDAKYRMHITGEDGFEIVGNQAAGEKLFLALSFIMALKKITNYRFPFIMDSPLGKTGGNLRIRFGTHMPELLDGSQFIMLATNTEYGKDKIRPEDGSNAEHTLKELFQKKVHVKEYMIDFNENDETAKILEAA